MQSQSRAGGGSRCWQKPQVRGTSGAQSVALSVSVLRLLGHDDGLAGLALIATLRKRLNNMPGDLAAGERRQVCLQYRGWTAQHRLLIQVRVCLWFHAQVVRHLQMSLVDSPHHG